MNVEGNEQGYNYSRLWLNSYLKSIDEWNTSRYHDRLKIIYDRFFNIWNYPDILMDEAEETEEQNIFDVESPRHKKLEYFIFENTKIEEDTIAQMYFYVIKSLYEKNSQLLLSNPGSIKIKREADEFRAGEEIVNGWFIESNIDSTTKFANLKKLLSLFEMEDELFIKYSSNESDEIEPNRFAIRRKYWQQLLPELRNNGLFANVTASKDHWLGRGAGISGLSYTLVITQFYVRVELTISTSTKEKNKEHFKKLFHNRASIEENFGDALVWEELPENKMSRIKIEQQDLNVFNEADWPAINKFMILNFPKFENALQPFVKNLR